MASSVVSAIGEPLLDDEKDTLVQIDTIEGVDSNPAQTRAVAAVIVNILAKEKHRSSTTRYISYLESGKFANAIATKAKATMKVDGKVTQHMLLKHPMLRYNLTQLLSDAMEEHIDGLPDDVDPTTVKYAYHDAERRQEAADLIAKAITLSHASLSRKGPSAKAQLRAKIAADIAKKMAKNSIK